MSRDRANHAIESERKRTDMEIWFDGRSVAIDYTVPNTLNLKQRTPGVKYDPLEVQNAAQNLKINKYADRTRNKNREFVPLVVKSLGGLGGAAVKLFGEIARSQASSRHPVGHILRRLTRSQYRKVLSKTSESCVSLFTRRPFQQHEGLPGTPQGDVVNNSDYVIINKLY